MPLTIPVAHDFRCEWCWVGLSQARKLQEEFGVTIDWRGFEIYPESMPIPEKYFHPSTVPTKPGRFEMLLWAEQMRMPIVERNRLVRTRRAHLAVEYARKEGKADALVGAIYHAYWEEGMDIGELEVLAEIGRTIVADPDAMIRAILAEQGGERIVRFDEEAAEYGVTHAPAFFIGDQRVVEEPYQVLRKAVVEELAKGETGAYAFLQLPKSPADRPYLIVDMVSTIDGKIVSGDRNDSVQDLGSKVDHVLMKRIGTQVDAVIIGAHTLRATSPKWNPSALKRFVVSRSGNLPAESAFLQNGEPVVVTSQGSDFDVPPGVRLMRFGEDSVDLSALLAEMKRDGIERVLVLGGSNLNGQLIGQGLMDEIFLTLAPKVKLGRDLPTMAEGDPFERGHLQEFALEEHHVIGDEVFLRYRRKEN
jgi:riboflavin biosynthesis pyrimidine reductase/predicted DsbA family dithiol-disulfide isomerase